jgi:hypothetical protein
MATKKQAVAALAKHCKQATLIDMQPMSGHQVQLEAPEGCHWECDVHCKAVPYWYDSKKAEYWDFVIEEIGHLSKAVPCDDNDCEGIRAWGECEYWEKD